MTNPIKCRVFSVYSEKKKTEPNMRDMRQKQPFHTFKLHDFHAILMICLHELKKDTNVRRLQIDALIE